MRYTGLRRVGVAATLAALAGGWVSADAGSAREVQAAAAPAPVFAPSTGVADPGVAVSGGDFLVYATGSLAPMSRGDTASGPWSPEGPALRRLGAWSSGGAVWAPDAVRIGAHRWILYYSAPVTGLDPNQRCIGVATAGSAAGPFTPSDVALVCPTGAADREGNPIEADDRVPGRPVPGSGVIDPAPFQAADDRRYLLYKTQQTPSSLRMLPLSADGTRAVGASRELVQSSGIIENPVMVQRGGYYVLFASRYGFNNCSYATVWMRSRSRWDFAAKTQHRLLTTSSTGICGPGGADVTPALDGGTRIFLHGWVCGSGKTPCRPQDAPFTGPHRRVLYAAVLRWGADGATPDVGAFLRPL